MPTDLEVFRDTIAHRRPSRVLFNASFTPDLLLQMGQHIGVVPRDAREIPAGLDVHGAVARHYGLWQPMCPDAPRPACDPERDYAKYWHGQELPPGTTFNWVGVAMVPSGFHHFWGFISPLRNAKSLKELEDYPLDDYSRWDFSGFKAQIERAHAAGKVVQRFIGHMYETAWQIRGYEPFLLDMIERPAWAECLLERLHRNARILARALAEAGADILATGDDVASQKGLMFSPQVWRKMILSRWAVIWQEVHALRPEIKTWYHTDGNCLSIVGEMADAGLDILNPLQPECLDLDAVYQRWGTRLCFDGCIGTQSTMPWGTPAQVRVRVKEVLEKYGRSGGLFIAPTHVLEPEVPIANIEALLEACREFGART